MLKKHYRTETNCLNCSAEVKDKFCPQCGQENIQIHENFLHVVRDYLADAFQFDSKIIRSLFPLIGRPGFLTKEYWDGKRIRYIHPLRVFFYVTVVFAVATTYFFDKFGSSMKETVMGDADLMKMDSATVASLKPDQKVFIRSENDSVSVDQLKALIIENDRQVNKYRSGFDFIFVNLKYVTFFLLPIYALIIKGFFRKHRRFYVDHLIYTIHLQTFVYCFFSFMMLVMYLYPLPLPTLRHISFGVIGTYIAISINTLYHLKWWRTLLNALFITIIFFFITMTSISALALLEAIYVE